MAEPLHHDSPRRLKGRFLLFENMALWPGLAVFVGLGALPVLFIIGVATGLFVAPGYEDSQVDKLLAPFSNGFHRASMVRSLVFALCATAVQLVVATSIAHWVFWSRTRALILIFLFLVVIPLAMTPVAIGLMWRALFDFQSGPVNMLLKSAGIGAVPWLSTIPVGLSADPVTFSEFSWGQMSLLLVDSWLWIPFLIGAELLAFWRIPRAYIDSAILNGASRLRILRKVMVPLCAPYLLFFAFLRFVDAYRTFDISWAFFGEQAPLAHFTSRVFSTGYLARDYPTAASLAIAGTLLVTPIVVFVASRIRLILVDIGNEEES